MNKTSIALLASLLAALTLSACVADGGGDDAADCAAPVMLYPDHDGDGYGDSTKGEAHCDAPDGFVALAGDCKDDLATVNPGGREICDLADNDCDGMIDDADPSLDMATTGTFYRDDDGDSYGVPGSTTKACVAPAGFAKSSADCDDTRSEVNPAAAEVCDFLDNDCDSKIDMADSSFDMASATTFYRDVDGDNVGSTTTMVACSKPSGYVAATGDCNDADNTAFPGGIEVCDGADNDCDGGTDGTPAQPNRCTALVGTYTGSYSHLTQEKLGSTVINSMSCTGTGNASLLLNRKPGLQGSFTCVYSGGLTLFSSTQHVTLRASVGLGGAVTGTVEHEYSGSSLKRTYNVTGTQTATGLSLTGTGSWYPNAMSAVPWTVSFNFATTR
jgi:hypothetical protein